ncbi:MAG: ATP-binding cassette domain-containing protein [Alphaproteobacteria bacterium]|nr:ATP-binding cassette domain-containing protein [Alphaproteobacteria bacterium]MBL6776595.1 ATP-binding cassette domain-containing protein [Alphaproteobacteria bacterium]
MLILKDIALSFQNTPLFAPLTLEIGGGDICVLSAPSGAGKSTLLRWVAGIPTEGLKAQGCIWLNGQKIDALPAERRRIGLMFQQPLLFPHLSVADNLGFGLPAAIKGETRKAQIEEALAVAGLEGMGGRDPETLSGGQQARIALLRTLLAKPEALLLDEPFSSLDDNRRTQIVGLVQREAQRLNLPVLLVSHDPRDVDAATNNVVQLEMI